MHRHQTLSLYLSLVLLPLWTAACSDSEGDGEDVVDETGSEAADDEVGEEGPRLASDLAIGMVSVNQGVESVLHLNGEDISPPTTRLVRGRHALVRVYVAPLDGWQPREIQAVLTLEGEHGSQTHEALLTVEELTTGDDLSSSFNFELSGEDLPGDQVMSVALYEVGDGSFEGNSSHSSWAGYAASFEDVAPLRVTLVPIEYNADGSGRLPDTSEAQLQLYSDIVGGMFPVPEVEFRVANPVPWDSAILPLGEGWFELLEYLQEHRATLDLDSDEYIYGLMSPTSTFGDFCDFGCLAGLSFLATDPGESGMRTSMGIGFSTEQSAFIMAHELGHAHGRDHTPCGLQGQASDPDYPHAEAILGTWGWDDAKGVLKHPAEHKDVMSYCDPQWVSDYTYDGLLERSLVVNAAARGAQEWREWDSARVDEDGLVPGSRRSQSLQRPLDEAGGGRGLALRYLNDQGDAVSTGEAVFYPMDHLPGGVLLWPSGPPSADAVEIQGFGLMAL